MDVGVIAKRLAKGQYQSSLHGMSPDEATSMLKQTAASVLVSEELAAEQISLRMEVLLEMLRARGVEPSGHSAKLFSGMTSLQATPEPGLGRGPGAALPPSSFKETQIALSHLSCACLSQTSQSLRSGVGRVSQTTFWPSINSHSQSCHSYQAPLVAPSPPACQHH